jgi:hypothetical protein
MGSIKDSDYQDAQLVKKRLDIINSIKSYDYPEKSAGYINQFNMQLEVSILSFAREADKEFDKGKVGTALYYQMLAETCMSMLRKENTANRLEAYSQFIH